MSTPVRWCCRRFNRSQCPPIPHRLRAADSPRLASYPQGRSEAAAALLASGPGASGAHLQHHVAQTAEAAGCFIPNPAHPIGGLFVYLTTSPIRAPLALRLCVPEQPTATPHVRAVFGVYDPERQVSVLGDGRPRAETTSAISLTCKGVDDVGGGDEHERCDVLPDGSGTGFW